MPIIKPNAPTLIVTAPRPLTSEQVDQVRAEIARQVPIGSVVVVVQPGFSVQAIACAPAAAEVSPAECEAKEFRNGALTELQRIGGMINEGIQALGSACIRVSHER